MKLIARTVPPSVKLDVQLANSARRRSSAPLRDGAAVSSSLQEMLIDAQQQGRLTCGIYDSGTLLAKSPDSVMLCILPEDASNDVALHIHFTLIEAFCLENDIRVVKVDSVAKIAKLLKEKATELEDNDFTRWQGADYNCLLIEYPQDCCSPAEEIILNFHEWSCDVVPLPVVQLDV